MEWMFFQNEACFFRRSFSSFCCWMNSMFSSSIDGRSSASSGNPGSLWAAIVSGSSVSSSWSAQSSRLSAFHMSGLASSKSNWLACCFNLAAFCLRYFAFLVLFGIPFRLTKSSKYAAFSSAVNNSFSKGRLMDNRALVSSILCNEKAPTYSTWAGSVGCPNLESFGFFIFQRRGLVDVRLCLVANCSDQYFTLISRIGQICLNFFECKMIITNSGIQSKAKACRKRKHSPRTRSTRIQVIYYGLKKVGYCRTYPHKRWSFILPHNHRTA